MQSQDSLIEENKWRDRHLRKVTSGRMRVSPAACIRGECGAHRTYKHRAPETPHSSGQGGSMFYTRENQSADSRGRLTRAILPVPTAHCGALRIARINRPTERSCRDSTFHSRSPLAILNCGYNKKSGCDSRAGVSESFNWHDLRKHLLATRNKTARREGFGGLELGGVLLLK
jgi:hypothetical protein